jgi:multidrug efflux pump subunit AcrB
MAEQDSAGADNQRQQALARQIGDLERHATELNAAFERAANVRRFLILVVVVLLGVYGYMYYQAGKALTSEDNLTKLGNRLQLAATNNQEEIVNEVQALLKHTQEPVTKAFDDRIKADLPVVTAALGKERENLAVNLKSRIEGQLEGQYKKALDEHRKILAEEFPAIKDDRALDKMTENFKDAFKPLVKAHYGDQIQAEFNKMYKTWDEFPIDDSKEDRDALAKKLYGMLFELMKMKIAHADQLAAAAKSL